MASNISSKESYNYYKEYISPYEIKSYNFDNLIDKEKAKDLICPICLQLLINPINCSDEKNSHSFCKGCIDKYLKEKDKCPICQLNFEYKRNNKTIDELNKLYFRCIFESEGCNKIVSYSEYFNHINNCKYNKIKYECQVKKYNYNNKEFQKCGYLGNIAEVEKHFTLCGFSKIKC